MKICGISAVSGIVFGKALIYTPYDYSGEVWEADLLDTVETKTAAYEQALAKAVAELDATISREKADDQEYVEILDAHRTLIEDVSMDEEIRLALSEGTKVSEAIISVYDMFIAILADTDSELTRARVADLQDVRNRLLRCLAGKPECNLSSLREPVVVVARELLPSDTANIDREKTLAIVTEEGGLTSHTVIIARSYGIPTVVGAEHITEQVRNGASLIVDAQEGSIYVEPTPEETDACSMKRERFLKQAEMIATYLPYPAQTRCGTRVLAELNISGADSVGKESTYSDGVGLMRSEFLYLEKQYLPSEEEQFAVYCAALEAFRDKPVILRTLDIGGDKQLDCLQLPKEENPFLGKRALRLCFDEPELFKIQLRAALRASAMGDLWIMFPMVGSLEDWRRAKQQVQSVMEELREADIAFNPDVKLGVMIEIPSIALMADKVAREVDFASIGTNDLCQYLMAADRMNPEVMAYYQMFHPAVFRLLRTTVEAFNRHGKPLGVCGEMAGTPAAALALLGLGIRAFSMGATSLARFKCMIGNTTVAEAEALAEKICDMDTAQEVQKILEDWADTILARTSERSAHADSL